MKPWDKLRKESPIGVGKVTLSGCATVNLGSISSEKVLMGIGSGDCDSRYTSQYLNAEACQQLAELLTELAEQLKETKTYV